MTAATSLKVKRSRTSTAADASTAELKVYKTGAVKTRAAKARATNVLYVKLKTNSMLTVDRTALEELVQHFGMDATFVAHYALARLRDEVKLGRLESAADVLVPPLATHFPTPAEMAVIQQGVDKGRNGGGTWQGSLALDAAMAML